MKQIYWNLAYLAATFFVTVSWIGATRFRSKMAEFKEVEVSSYWDLKYLLLYFPLYAVIRISFSKIFENTILKNLMINDPENYETKKVRIVKEAFGSFWYALQALIGYFMFADTNLLPKLCFGTLECGNFFRDWPLTMPDWKIRAFFMLQMAFHIYTVIEFEIKNRSKKVPEYNEMRLHHILATIMIFLCYISNTFPFGVTILFVADFTDLPLNFTKFSRDMKFLPKTKFVDILFVWTISSWIYFRGVVMGACVMKGCFTAIYHIAINDTEWFNPVGRATIFSLLPHFIAKTGMEMILVALNMYWIYLLVMVAYNRVVNKDSNFTNKNWGEKSKSTLDGAKNQIQLRSSASQSQENGNSAEHDQTDKKLK